MRSRAYTLAEVLLALALSVIVVLTLVGLGLTALSGNQKSTDLTAAQSLCHQWLEEEIYGAQADSSAPIWAANSPTAPYQQKQAKVGNTDYAAAYYASDVSDAAMPNLKLCRLRVSWWGGAEARQGYGRLYTEALRYVSKP
ncbi:hypothetical protein JST97_28550 [bacterium]|nr:hypothetical protein [bacterium]